MSEVCCSERSERKTLLTPMKYFNKYKSEKKFFPKDVNLYKIQKIY